MKIDVEGSEPAVVVGAMQLIAHCRPVILLEINPAAMEAAGTIPSDFCRLLRSLGYDRSLILDSPSVQAALVDELPPGDIVLLPAG